MKELLTSIDRALCRRFEALELESVRRALCTEYLGISALSYYTKETLKPDVERDRRLADALARLAGGEPLQYLLGWAPFCGLQFKVDSRVLIPRPETAELVEWVEQDCAGTGSLLDIGTGSGCIAVTLAHKLPGWKVQGWDISADALDVARENSRLNGTQVTFSQVDILADAKPEGRFDVIVSNPPYVLDSERDSMESTVLDYEPHTALFVRDNDPLVFYRAIAEFAVGALNGGGRLYFEINPLKAQDMNDLLVDAGFHNVELRNDIFGKTRMIKAVL